MKNYNNNHTNQKYVSFFPLSSYFLCFLNGKRTFTLCYTITVIVQQPVVIWWQRETEALTWLRLSDWRYLRFKAWNIHNLNEDNLFIVTKFIILMSRAAVEAMQDKDITAAWKHRVSQTLHFNTSLNISELRNVSSPNVLLARVTFKVWAIQIYFLPFGSKDRSVSALSPVRGRRILSNLSCLMKNSASWPPISAVSGCYVRYRGRGAGERGGNCFGLLHCMISIIVAMDFIHPHIL